MAQKTHRHQKFHEKVLAEALILGKRMKKLLIQHTVNSLFSTPNQQDLRRRHSVAVVKPNLIENRKHKESKSQDDSQGESQFFFIC